MLFFEEALIIFVRLAFFMFQVVLCSIDVIWNFIYLISSLVGSVFFTILTNGCVIFLDFFSYQLCFSPSSISYSGILFLWPEVGPELLGCQH